MQPSSTVRPRRKLSRPVIPWQSRLDFVSTGAYTHPNLMLLHAREQVLGRKGTSDSQVLQKYPWYIQYALALDVARHAERLMRKHDLFQTTDRQKIMVRHVISNAIRSLFNRLGREVQVVTSGQSATSSIFYGSKGKTEWIVLALKGLILSQNAFHAVVNKDSDRIQVTEYGPPVGFNIYQEDFKNMHGGLTKITLQVTDGDVVFGNDYFQVQLQELPKMTLSEFAHVQFVTQLEEKNAIVKSGA